MGGSYPMTVTSSSYRYYSYQTDVFNGVSHVKTGGHFSGVTSDVVTRYGSPINWRDVIARSGNAGSVLTGSRRTCKAHYGTYYSSRTDGSGIYHFAAGCAVNPLTRIPLPNTSVSTQADDQARSKLLGNYINARNNWRGGNFLAEVGETINMLRHPVHSLFGNTTHFVNKVGGLRLLKNPRDYAKHLGNLWLAYSFGWKPLFEDIKDANKAISALQQSPRHDTIKINGSGRFEGITSSGIVVLGNFPGMDTTLSTYRFNRTSSEVKYYGAVTARPPTLSTIAESFGVDPYDVIPAIWEAIPWSFFVDYFLNVQEVLDSMRYANSGLAWLMKGVRNTVTVKATTPWISSGMVAGTSYSPGISAEELKAVYVNRQPINDLPYPRVHFKVPGLGSLKWLNTAALISQIQRSKPKYL